MSEYSHPGATARQPPLTPATRAKSGLRISAGTASILVGFWGGSVALALHSMSSYLGPRFSWLAVCLGAAAACAVLTGCVQIIRHQVCDLRIPALSIAFCAINVLAYVGVYKAFPLVTPMLGGLVLAATAIIVLAMALALDAPHPVRPGTETTHVNR